VPSSAIRSIQKSIPRNILGNVLEVNLGTSWELTWKHIVKQAGSVSLHPIGSVLQNMLRSLLDSVLKAYTGANSQSSRNCTSK